VKFLDLDRFKVVQRPSVIGSATLLLRDVAAAPEAVLRRTKCCELGGDEFAIVVRDFESRSDLEALQIAWSRLSSIPYDISGYHIRSMSASHRDRTGKRRECDDLLMAADLASMRSRAHRGTFQFYTPR